MCTACSCSIFHHHFRCRSHCRCWHHHQFKHEASAGSQHAVPLAITFSLFSFLLFFLPALFPHLPRFSNTPLSLVRPHHGLAGQAQRSGAESQSQYRAVGPANDSAPVPGHSTPDIYPLGWHSHRRHVQDRGTAGFDNSQGSRWEAVANHQEEARAGSPGCER